MGDSSDEDDFLRFQWDMNGDTDDGSESKEEEKITIHNNDDLLQELSRLEMDEVGYVYGSDLHSVVQRIGSSFLWNSQRNDRKDLCIICNVLDFRQRNNAVKQYMGSMAQCRGAGGDALREAGAISALLDILWRLIVPLQVQNHCNEKHASTSLLPTMTSDSHSNGADYLKKNDLDSTCSNHLYLQSNNLDFDSIAMDEWGATALDLATSCLGALRDLSCGSALNRAAFLEWQNTFGTHDEKENGVHVLSAYLKRYDKWKWEEILSFTERRSNINSNAAAIESTTYTDRGKKELRLLTNVLGVIRNASHSTPDVCQEFFKHGLVDPLIWRLMPDILENSQSSLPDASRPWREACFRAASSLINLAEKCPDVACQLGSNRKLIYLLIETWGGASAISFDPNKANGSTTRGLPLLHLGLAAILNAAGNGALDGGLDDVMAQVLEKEKTRKRVAQRREEDRKLQAMKHKF